MNNISVLKDLLVKIDAKGFKEYKKIKDEYNAENYNLIIDHVQGDPFATPSKIIVKVPTKTNKYPQNTYSNISRKTATCDYINRCFYNQSKKYSKNDGANKSGLIKIYKPLQEILERTAVNIDQKYIEVRFLMGLPANGRRINSKYAIKMFFEFLPEIINQSLIFDNINTKQLYNFIEVNEDADFLRNKLEELELIAFVANNSLLPRKSGIDDKPMSKEEAILFKSPESFKKTINLPNYGNITGMGISKGITLIVGGGYNGKSTLLNALELGVYNHVPGDGREFVITNSDAVKIRAEDGRRIEKTFITPFISNLPFNKQTDNFCSDDASGSTSQAANIIEAIEVGAKTLLVDEDTSATNFMIRDHRMQELVKKEKEPITPFVDKIKQLYLDNNISTILVMGGSGDYFDVAGKVICMTEYEPIDVSEEANNIAKKYIAERKEEGGDKFGEIKHRCPIANSIDASKGKKNESIIIRNLHIIQLGMNTIDLGAIEQLIEYGQTNAIAHAILFLKKYMDGKRSINDILILLFEKINKDGLDILSEYKSGDLTIFRKYELAAALNRLRTFKIK